MILPGNIIKHIPLLLIAIYGFYSLLNTGSEIYHLSQEEAQMKNKIVILNEKKQELKEKLELTNSEDFVEKEARTRLNMKKPGEEVYIVPTSENKDSTNREQIDYKNNINNYNVLGITTEVKTKSNAELWADILF
jgi:cell division protein FtsB